MCAHKLPSLLGQICKLRKCKFMNCTPHRCSYNLYSLYVKLETVHLICAAKSYSSPKKMFN